MLKNPCVADVIIYNLSVSSCFKLSQFEIVFLSLTEIVDYKKMDFVYLSVNKKKDNAHLTKRYKDHVVELGRERGQQFSVGKNDTSHIFTTVRLYPSLISSKRCSMLELTKKENFHSNRTFTFGFFDRKQ